MIYGKMSGKSVEKLMEKSVEKKYLEISSEPSVIRNLIEKCWG